MLRSYPAKILLFGEHTVLRGGRGLAVPYHRLNLRWEQDQPDERLLQFCDYLQTAIPTWALNAGALESFLLTNWRLAGNIPTGYGLGSSGAVCAAIWDRFATDHGKALQGEDLRKMLARMEQHFHGSSSGTDPLICYLQQPVILGGNQPPRMVPLAAGWDKGFFLVDTGRTRSAASYINTFTQRYDQETAFRQEVDTNWREPADRACEALITGDRASLVTAMRKISNFQLREISQFIPPTFHVRWLHESYILKICGAGGGGVLLGLSHDRQATERALGEVWWLEENSNE
ncbi:MAG: hypothetical protein AAGF89_05490 [Bacteroidota bacterium]